MPTSFTVLPRKQSIPAMSLYLPPPAIGNSDFQWPEASFAPRSCSAPMPLMIPGRLLPADNYSNRRDKDGGETGEFTEMSSSSESIKALSIKSAPGSPYRAKLAEGFESSLLQDLSPFRFGETLPNGCEVNKNPITAPPSFFTKDTDIHSPSKRSLRPFHRGQGELVSHSPIVSKRLSSRCLKAFRKLRSPSSPEYQALSDCEIDSAEIETISAFNNSNLSLQEPPRASIELKRPKAKSNYKPPNVTEDVEPPTPRASRTIRPSSTRRVCSDATIIIASRDNGLQQETKVAKRKSQLSLLKMANDLSSESLESKPNDHAIVDRILGKSSEVLSKFPVDNKELGEHDVQKKALEKTEVDQAGRIDKPEPNMDAILNSIYQENRKKLEKIGAKSIHQEADTIYSGSVVEEKEELHDVSQTDPEATPRQSRFATWKVKAKVGNWLAKKKGIPRRVSGNPNPEPPRLKKSPSLLFRLWNSSTDSGSEGCQQKNSLQKAARTSRQDVSHLLENVIAERGIVKARERILAEDSSLRFDDITNKKKKRRVSKALSQIFRENEPRENESIHVIEDSSLPPASINPGRQGEGVSWNGSLQEYTGSLGQVCPSGRSVSGTLRSREAKPPSLKLDVGLCTETSFESSSLADDWDVAMRAMEEISSAEPQLKRTGAVKHKRTLKKGKDPISDADGKKDGIGRSFSRQGGMPITEPQGPQDSESEKSILSPFTSQESLYRFLEFS